MNQRAEIVICGAGIAGISAAYHLAVKRGIRNVLLVDQNPPLSLTSDKSSECYRNWWPGPGNEMVALMNRSIDLLEDLARESGNIFNLSRRGYLYLTAQAEKLPGMQRSAEEISRLGGGPLRIHTGSRRDPDYFPAAADEFEGQPEGADLILDPLLIRQYFPYVSEKVVGALHVRRAGWFSGQQLGAYLLELARAGGVRLERARLSAVETTGGRVRAAVLEDGSRIETDFFVNAGGPLLPRVGRMLGLDLPVYSELHLKVAFNDYLKILPRHAPLLIWNDAQKLPWTEMERQLLAEDEGLRWLLDELPPGAHTRPEGGPQSPILLMLWEYRTRVLEPVWPVPIDPDFADIVLRGLAAMLPGLSAYIDRSLRPSVDGGYYTKTAENRPLIGPMEVEGAYLIGALSGYGLMAACAAGELLAAHLTQAALPPYARAFMLERYREPAYMESFAGQDPGQL